jgi:hypothetical protein
VAKQLSTCARVMVFGALTLIGPLTAMAAPPAPPDGDAGSFVNLEIDAEILGSAVAPRLERDIAIGLGPALEQADLHVVSTSEIGEQTLSVRVITFDEDQRNYKVDLEMSSDGGVVTMFTAQCDACTERRLIAKLVEGIPRLVEMHEENQGEAIAREPPPPREPSQGAQPALGGSKRTIGPVGITGAAMIGVGVLALAAGGYLLGRDVEPDGAFSPALSPIPTKSFLPAAGGTLAAGVALAGVGATLLVLDLERARKGRVRRFALQMTPSYVGIQIYQRF